MLGIRNHFRIREYIIVTKIGIKCLFPSTLFSIEDREIICEREKSVRKKKQGKGSKKVIGRRGDLQKDFLSRGLMSMKEYTCAP
jgi:hypothetical protein